MNEAIRRCSYIHAMGAKFLGITVPIKLSSLHQVTRTHYSSKRQQVGGGHTFPLGRDKGTPQEEYTATFLYQERLAIVPRPPHSLLGKGILWCGLQIGLLT